MEVKIVWDELAFKQFEKAIKYIENDSLVNAEKVSKEILLKIDSLIKHPEIYPLDKYKLNNDGAYRAFEIHRYRVSYWFMHNEIIILRIRHTRMKPLFF